MGLHRPVEAGSDATEVLDAEESSLLLELLAGSTEGIEKEAATVELEATATELDETTGAELDDATVELDAIELDEIELELEAGLAGTAPAGIVKEEDCLSRSTGELYTDEVVSNNAASKLTMRFWVD